MPNRNPNKPHRFSEKNQHKTQERIEQYYGLIALLNTWESMPNEIQIKAHDYIIRLRTRVRNVKNYILNRADPNADIF